MIYTLFKSTVIITGLSIAPAFAQTSITNCDTFINTNFQAQEKYIIENDIDCAGSAINNPLDFRGELDGQGYTIRDLVIQSDQRYTGLFSEIIEAKIVNLRLENITAKSSYRPLSFGVLAGVIRDSKLDNIEVANSQLLASSLKISQGVGLVAGRITGSNNVSSINVNNSTLRVGEGSYIGSIFGYVQHSKLDKLKSQNNRVYIDADGRSSIGGLVGKATSTKINNSDVSDILVSAPWVDKASVGILAGALVTTDIHGANLIRNSLDTQESSRHLSRGIVAGNIYDPQDSKANPSLKNINYEGEESLDWFNAKEVVHTMNFNVID
ncbi:hypothetical protein [Vibrio parahaemolyticus]|uniref:hypothetical protein n=1 Tax=Vibrio parahaemolyticus TaxID=670 RepID=UPI00226A22C3|nr:hypothetical protein [Vibrio parahaemolyticus]MCX8799670.1 hypothetical protein [Vibrio parahaemolyticus]